MDNGHIIYFVYTCPENSKVRSRMLFSTSKATVLQYVAEKGIEVQKFVEVCIYKAAVLLGSSALHYEGNFLHGIADIELRTFQVSEPNEIDSEFLSLESATTNGDTDQVELKQPILTKPRRPGRGRARLTKKN